MNDAALRLLATNFVREQSEGEWGESTIADDAEKLFHLLKAVSGGEGGGAAEEAAPDTA